MKKKNQISEATAKARLKELESRHKHQSDCSHSFNDQGVCEYCDLSEEDYSNSPEPIGKYE